MDKDNGVLKEDMSVEELRALAVDLGILDKEKAEKAKKNTLLKSIGAWEKAELAKREKEGKKILGNAGIAELPVAPVKTATNKKCADGEDCGVHEGKKVVSRVAVVEGDHEYEDIIVETGETYRKLIK